MINPNEQNEHFRFGSARLGEVRDALAAGLLGDKKGAPIYGFLGGYALSIASDSPVLTCAGSGAGKLRDVLAGLVCTYPGNMLILDLKGEIAAISQVALIQQGARPKAGYYINAFGLNGLPAHRFNPLDILTANSITLHQDAKVIAESLIQTSGGGNSDYFEGRARELVEKGAKYRVIKYGGTTLPELYRMLCTIDSQPETWQLIAEDMMRCGLGDVRAVAGEMLHKQKDAPGEFSAIMGTLHKNLNFVTDPAIERTLSGGDFSLEVFADPALRANVYIMVPAQYVGALSSFLRLTFAVAATVKQRSPDAPTLYLLCDESSQLGHFEALERCVTYGRGAVRTHTVWQDLGQITRHYGPSGLQTFLGSSQVRQFFGIRDIQSATIISQMLGTQTLEFDDPLQQAGAQKKQRHALFDLLTGEVDPFMAAADVMHFAQAAHHRTKQARQLRTPSEVMALAENLQYLFISGVGCPPLEAERRSYITRPDLAGRYLSNPYHEQGFVQVATRWGQRRARVITAEVPRCLEYLPQYAGRSWQYVEGYKPDLRHLQALERRMDRGMEQVRQAAKRLEHQPGRGAGAVRLLEYKQED